MLQQKCPRRDWVAPVLARDPQRQHPHRDAYDWCVPWLERGRELLLLVVVVVVVVLVCESTGRSTRKHASPILQ